MTLVSWQSRFELGIPAIDDQHAAFVVMLNRNHAQMVAGWSSRPSALGDTLELLSFLSTHFHDEEQLMSDSCFPGLPGHAAQHRACIVRAWALERRLEAEEASSTELYTFLSGWFEEHLLGEDMQFKDYLMQGNQLVPTIAARVDTR